MTRRLRATGVVAALACVAVALATGGAVGQDAGNESVAALAGDAHERTDELRHVTELRDQRFAHIGSGAAAGVGLGLVVGSLVSFELWRARLR